MHPRPVERWSARLGIAAFVLALPFPLTPASNALCALCIACVWVSLIAMTVRVLSLSKRSY